MTKKTKKKKVGIRELQRRDTERRKKLYLEHLEKYGIPAAAAVFVERSMNTVRSWRQDDPVFAEMEVDAMEIANGALEMEMRRRAIEGDEEMVVQSGEVVYMRNPETGELITDELGDPIPVVKKIRSDRLLETLAKANMPEKYRENVKVNHAMSGGVLLVGMSGEATEEGKARGMTLLEELEAQQAPYRAPMTIDVDAEELK